MHDSPIDIKRLVRSWIHAFEEDLGGLLTYRPEGTALPPARGRDGFVLTEDGGYRGRAPGPDDRPVAVMGTWVLRGMTLDLVPDGGEPSSYLVVELSEELLRLRRAQARESEPAEPGVEKQR